MLVFLPVVLALVLALVVALAGLPMLVSTEPQPGLAAPQEIASDASRFLRIPFEGTEGVNIHYLSGGRPRAPEGPDFLLLHGFTFNAFTWSELLDFFAARGRVVAYDQPPYGLSAKLTRADWQGPSPYTREAAVAQLFAVMDGLGMEQAVLVGNSAGGSLALEAALARPERVAALILLDPWVYVRRPTLPQTLAALPQFERLSLWMARYLGRSDALLRRSYADPARITPERRRLSAIHTGAQNWDLAWGALLHRSLSDAVTVSGHLAAITQPTLVVSGREDELVPLADSERLVSAMANASLVVIPDCGHMPQEECPAPVRRAIDGWLSEQGIGGGDGS